MNQILVFIIFFFYSHSLFFLFFLEGALMKSVIFKYLGLNNKQLWARGAHWLYSSFLLNCNMLHFLCIYTFFFEGGGNFTVQAPNSLTLYFFRRCLSKETYSPSAYCAPMSYFDTCLASDPLSLIIKWDILFSRNLIFTILVVFLLLILCDLLTEGLLLRIFNKSISSFLFVEKERERVHTTQTCFHSCR